MELINKADQRVSVETSFYRTIVELIFRLIMRGVFI
ncbi:hypothetical protein BACCIP111883_01123 [Sutcliffiella rhizosphaerae]|uniref:Uncharacterized protein n=1 Tax=Sutcliffiella rhizosphaerae TaxID=2880967 RepID=A0ABM8YK84_9BACI|nr:hypothetical protein BACCIP111883_01123 [Sutcliffiella rhizosphaerae]